MSKVKAWIVMAVTILLLGGLGYVAVCGIGENRAGSAANIKQGLDLAGGVSITYEVAGEETPSSEDMSDTIYKLQQRVQTYSTEAQVYQEGQNRINIEIPGVSDANAILTQLGAPGTLSFIRESGEEVLTGTDIVDAQAGTYQDDLGNSQFVVQLRLNEEGTKKFAQATTEAVKTNEIIYIIYDDQIVSSPRVNSAITDGSAVIEGMESFEEADRLASTIRIGGLKLELTELRSNVVGAQLGQQAISTSLKAGAIGLGLVILFMLIFYLIPGLAASLALCVYVVLTVLLISGFDLTLTLPGIAGIILSIGMAVDANIIIFARIKEEIAAGKTVRVAIQTGFKKALSAIIDGNITTLLAAAVLGFMGTGSVKGFAQTLALGIIVSMFTALVVTRLLLNALYAIGFKEAKFYGTAKQRKGISFMKHKKAFFGLSIAMILAGFVAMGVNYATTGDILNFSLEFKGGTSNNVIFQEDMDIDTIDAEVVPVIEEITGDGNVQFQKVQGGNEVVFKTRSLSVEEREEFNQAMADHFGVDPETITTESISSTISSEMKSDAIIAVCVATVLMLIYIWFRFKDIRFGASSVAALIHDVLVVLAFYAIARISVGNTFIACMLTIVGYSINATIVIFDRIRENMGHGSKTAEQLGEIVDRSINQTLTRSIFTSLTTFIMVAALYVLGVSSIREFALPLMVGIVCGAYSSVCVTGPLWYVMKTRLGKKKK